MKPFKMLLLIAIILVSISSCHQSNTYDLAIETVNIFDVHNGEVIENKTILVKNSLIESIIDADEAYKADQVIEGKGRLVTPGFVDTHIHLTDMFGDYVNAPEYLVKDSIDYYRNQLSATYLQYGTTTVMDMGQPEKWMAVTLNWQKHPASKYPNLYITGGAMISDEERAPYISHTEVKSPEEAEQKVQHYHQLGLRHLKLYWRLREPEMKAIVNRANELDMHLYGHIDEDIISVQEALSMRVKNFEHLQSIALSTFSYDDHYEDMRSKFGIPDIESVDEFIAMRILVFKYMKEDKVLHEDFEELLSKLGQQEATLSTTIHLLGSVAERTYFTTSAAATADITTEVLPRYSIQQKELLNSAFDIAMDYLKSAHSKGVKIRIGTDCREGGKAMLSELILLYEAGFTMNEILQIATINGAEALFLQDTLGSIAEGKNADLLIFENDPFQDHAHLLGKKLIIKDGKIMGDD